MKRNKKNLVVDYMRKEYQEILDQAPEGTTIERIEMLWHEHHGDVVAIIAKLWDVPEKTPKEKNKWDIIREICDEYDATMDDVIRKSNNKST